MKRVKVLALAALMVPFSFMNTSCIGSFAAFNAYVDWCNDLGNKWINWIVYLLTGWLAVPITLFVDGLVLNSIEFWTGSNPLAMAPGDKETELVKGEDGNTYEIAATQNRFDVSLVTEEGNDWKYAIVFAPETKSWSFDYEEESITLMTLSEDNSYVTMHLPGDRTLDMNVTSSNNFAQQAIEAELSLLMASK